MKHLIALLLGVAALTACQSFYEPLPPQPQPQTRLPSGPPKAPTPPPAAEQTPEAPVPPKTPPKQFRLSAASSALVTQAHTQSKSGNALAAAATLERALRIEPSNPLLWIELGRLRLTEKNPAQADSMGHKALALATGDPNTQAAAWRLIAESLRARSRDDEADKAEDRAKALLVAPVAYDEVAPLIPSQPEQISAEGSRRMNESGVVEGAIDI
jgi:tetratricopeptide (TPR) repeat protein